MSLRPTIFISAVSKELKSARQLVANTLTFLGYEPIWQDIFGTEQGDLREMLRRQINECDGVVQLVGERYGAEPPEWDEQFGRVSYAQYEARYAEQQGKKVWYLVLGEDFPRDAQPPEPNGLHELQSRYRQRLRTESKLRHSVGSHEGLEISIHKLRNELEILRAEQKQWVLAQKRWAAAVAILLVMGLGLGVWLSQRQESTSKQVAETNRQLAELNAKMEKLLKDGKFPEAETQTRQEQRGQNPAAIERLTYEKVARQQGGDAKLWQEKFPQFARERRNAPHATAYERANAAYVIKDYAEAERLALVAADEAQKAAPPNRVAALEAYRLAGNAADARVEYSEALRHFREGEKLTDRARDPLEWARQQWSIAFLLDEQGQYAEAENVYRGALQEFQRTRGEKDRDVLSLRNNLANDLNQQGKYAQAETEHRTVLGLTEAMVGPEHPETLASRMNLANDLTAQGKYSEAETEYRAVVKLREKALGPEHPDTLGCRMNLASVLRNQGKYAEAEAEFRAIIKLREKALDPESPGMLMSRMNLASVLNNQGKHAEAEAESRAVIKLAERVFGPVHPGTLMSRMNLASALIDQGKYAEAEAECRAVAKRAEKAFTPKHPNTLLNRLNLANAINGQGRHSEAEAEYRDVTKLQEEVLGPEHPNTLASCYFFAVCLKAENKMDEANEFARRAAQGASKVLGANHPDTQLYEKLWRELQTRN